MDDEKHEKPLQAVLLADSFTSTFRPVSFEVPKVLFPLGNVPMLAYSLEMLASNDVKQVFIFCINHSEQIRDYVESSGWSKKLNIEVLSSNSCTSAGDVMRELDQQGKIESDPFVLISGDVISNIDLKSTIALHKARRKQRAENIMTMLFKRVGRSARTRPLGDDLMIGLNDTTQQIIYYNNNIDESAMKIPNLVLGEHDCLTLHSDLLDCHVDICSPEVLWRFSENFDYLELRDGFVASEVANLDLGQYIFAHILSDPKSYSARVHDPRCYHNISHDVVHRWVFPIVPELNLAGWQESQYRRSHINASVLGGSSRDIVYKDSGVIIPRSSKLSGGVVIGRNTAVGDNSVISSSTIGAGCSIGENVKIVQSHLWRNVIVEDGASVIGSILCDGVIIRKGACVNKGCIVSFGCIVDKDIIIAPFTRLTLSNAKEDDGFSDDEENDNELAEASEGDMNAMGLHSTKEFVSDIKVVGTEGLGKVYVGDNSCVNASSSEEGVMMLEDTWAEEDDDKPSLKEILTNEKGTSIGNSEVLSLSQGRHLIWNSDDESDSETESESEDGEEEEGFTNEDEDIKDINIEQNMKFSDKLQENKEIKTCETSSSPSVSSSLTLGVFEKAVGDILVTGWTKKDPVEALLMEVNCYKLAQNRTFEDCLNGVGSALIHIALQNNDDKNALKFLKQFQIQILYWKPLLSKLTQGKDEEAALVLSLESACLRPELSDFLSLHFVRILKLFFDEDVVSDEGISKWSNDRKVDIANGVRIGEEFNRLFNAKTTQEFISWVEESEEEESDEDESD